MRPPLGETPGRRLTQRNLYAVLQCIDFSNPGESPMLKASGGSSSGGRGGRVPHALFDAIPEARAVGLPGGTEADAGRGRRQARHASVCRVGRWRPGAGPQLGLRRIFRISPLPPGEVQGVRAKLPRRLAGEKDGKDKKDSKDRVGQTPRIRRPAVNAGRHAKPKTASKESDENRVPPRIQADRAAAQAIDSIDPYDPAGFNNQADAPTEMPTPAARTLGGAQGR